MYAYISMNLVEVVCYEATAIAQSSMFASIGLLADAFGAFVSS
jgi:hypothetical protein